MATINLFKHDQTTPVDVGTTLFRAGDPGDAMIAVVEGAVELRHGDQVYERVEAGGILGEMALLDDAPRSADAVVVASARIVRVDSRAFTYLVQEHPTFAIQVMRVMAERIRRANARLGTEDAG